MPELNALERGAVKSRLGRRLSDKSVRPMLLGLYLPEKPFILEIGCGPGAALMAAAEIVQPSLAIGLDIDAKMIATAKRNFSRRGMNAKFIQGRAESLPIAPESFDLVIGFEVLHHVDDWRQAVQEVARVLKPGGHFLSRDAINPEHGRWIGRLLHRIPKNLTWRNLAEQCWKSGLELSESHHSSFHEEQIFVKKRLAGASGKKTA